MVDNMLLESIQRQIATCLLLIQLTQVSQQYNHSYVLKEEDSVPQYLGNLIMDLRLISLIPTQELESRPIAFFPSNQEGEKYFDIFKHSSITQELRLKRRLDREEVCSVRSNQLSLCQCDGDSPISSCYLLMNFALMPFSARFIYFSIRVNISDINDNSPTFRPSTFQTSFSESDPVDTKRQIPVANDADIGSNALITYRLETHADLFRLDWTKSNQILNLILKQPLDRENADSYKLYVIAQDSGSSPNSGQLIVTITVTDVNDMTPRFNQNIYNSLISEAAPINTPIVQVQASDDDILENGLVSYHLDTISNQVVGKIFHLDETTGSIKLQASLDRESAQVYNFMVLAVDQGSPKRSSSATVIIQILDVNDNIPNIQIASEASIKENKPPNTVVTTFSVIDHDNKENGSVSCFIYDHDVGKDFGNSLSLLNNVKLSMTFSLSLLAPDVVNTYKLEALETFDREKQSDFNATILCRDKGTPTLHASKLIHVRIVDENDEAPIFTSKIYSAGINENNKIGEYITKVEAHDKDINENALIIYFFFDKSENKFHIDEQTGVVRALESLDRESQDQYKLLIGAADQGEPALTATSTLSIRINDLNDVSPKIKVSGTLAVKEHEPAGITVAQVSTFDPDLGDGGKTTVYLTDSSDFALKPDGTIVTKRSFDREVKEKITLTVYAKDEGNPSLTSTEHIDIVLHDINDWAPEFAYPTEEITSLNVSYKERSGFLIAQISARDRDFGENGRISYHLNPPSSLFKLDESSARLTTAKEYSMEDMGRYALTYVAQDHGTPKPLRTSKHLVIYLTDEPPKWMGSTLAGRLDNFSIMIIISCVSGVLIFALVIAIIAVVRKKHGACSRICGNVMNRNKNNSYGSGSCEPNHGANVNRHNTTKKLDPEFTTSPSHVPLRIQEEPFLTNAGTQQYFEMSSIGSAPGSNSDSGKGGSTESNAGSTHMNNSSAIVACSQPPGPYFVTPGISTMSYMNNGLSALGNHSTVETTCFGVIPKGGINSKFRRPNGNLSGEKLLSTSLNLPSSIRIVDDIHTPSKTEALTNTFYSPRRELRNHVTSPLDFYSPVNDREDLDQNHILSSSSHSQQLYLSQSLSRQNSQQPKSVCKISFQDPETIDSPSSASRAYSINNRSFTDTTSSKQSPNPDYKTGRLLKLLDLPSRTSIV